MNHAGITSGCATCHASGLSFTGVTVVSKPANHIPTTAACESCHAATNFTAFGPNTPMNHAGISQRLHHLPRGGGQRHRLCRGDAAAAGGGPHSDLGRLLDLPRLDDFL